MKVSKKASRNLDPSSTLLDPGSQIHLLRSKGLVSSTRSTPFPTKVTGVSKDPITVKQVADHPDFGVVYFSEAVTASIVSFATLEESFSVNQTKSAKDITSGYVATRRDTGETLCFSAKAGLFVYSDCRLPWEARSYISTVKLRKTRYTKKEVERADLAHLIRERTGWPSTATMKKLISTGGVLSMPITSKDTDRDLDTYGRAHADAAGKFTYKPTPSTPEEALCDEASKLVESLKSTDMTLYCDLILVGGITFLVSVSRPLDYVIVSKVKTKGWLDTLSGTQEHKSTYSSHGYNNLKTTRFDSEKGVERTRNLLTEKLELKLETSAPHQHVPVIEAKNRRVKERVRCLTAHLPYKLNTHFLSFLPRYVARRLSICPSSHSGVNVSPYEVLTGVKVDYKKELKVGFGEAAHVYSRTDQAISLVSVPRVKKLATCTGFSNNKECSAVLYSLGKGMKQRPVTAVADSFDPVPLSDAVVVQLSHIAEGVIDPSPDLESDDDDDNIDDHIDTPVQVESDPPDLDHLPDTSPSEFIGTSIDAETDPAKTLDPSTSSLPDNYTDDLEDDVDTSTHPDDDDGQLAVTPPSVDESLRGEDHQENNNQNDSSTISQSDIRPQGSQRYHTRSRDGTSSKKHMDETYFYHKIVKHISMQAGTKKHQDAATDSILKETTAVEDKHTLRPLNAKDLSYKQKKRAIRSFILMKEKFDAAGKFTKLKSRLTASGKQQDRVLVENSLGSVSSPTLSVSSFTMMLATAKSEQRHLATTDTGSAYLSADMSKEDVIVILDKVVADQYIKTKPEYKRLTSERGEMYVKLEKALYGSLQASKLWYQNLSSFLKKRGYVVSDTDPCVFNKWVGKECISVGVYVDDLLITATDKKLVKELKLSLVGEYKDISYDDGNTITYLGMLTSSSSDKYIDLSVPQFIDDLVSDLSISDSDLSKSPASAKLFNILPSDPSLSNDDKEAFHTSVAKLLYLGKRARPDTLLAATLLCTRVRAPGNDDLKKLKRCVRYLSATKGKTYRTSASKNTFDMCVYVDASFAVHDTVRSHSGATLSLGSGVVVYCESLKQKLSAKSSTEAELIAVSDVLPQVVACRNFLAQQLREDITTSLYQDSKSTVALVKSGRPLAKSTRHISTRLFFTSDYQARGEVKVEHLASEKMVADFYTKPLQGSLLSDHCDFIMGHKIHKEANVLCCTIQRLIKRASP